MAARKKEPPPLGAVVRRRRQALGLTQEQLASKADIAAETISRIERGRLVPSVKAAERVARALKVSLSDLAEPGRLEDLDEPGVRASEARLLAAVRDLDDTDVDDITRALKVLLAVGRRTARS